MVTIDITMVIQMINMVVLMFLLNGVLYKPVKKILKERSEKMQGMQNDVAKFEDMSIFYLSNTVREMKECMLPYSCPS